MIAQVIPAKRGLLRLPFFDYLVPPELEETIAVGQLVTIPLRSKEEFGMIRGLTKTSAIVSKLKALSGIVTPVPLLSTEQLVFLEEMSELYHTSLGFLIKSNLLPLQKRKLKTLPQFTVRQKHAPVLKKPACLLYHNEETLKTYLTEHIDYVHQTLILVPEVHDTERIMAMLPNDAQEMSIAITSDLSVKDMFAAWVAIWSGEKRIIIGTRGAVFMPLNDLSTIIVENEGNEDHKSWDMAPRYNAREAALMLAKHHGAELHLTTHTPSVETHYFTTHGIYENVQTTDVRPFENKMYSLLNVQSERRAGNPGQLSFELLDTLEHTTGTVFLLCHRKGTMSYVSCRDCKHVFTCPTCKRSLTFHHHTKKLICHHCGYNEPMRPTCPKCQGITMALYGVGVDYIGEELKKRLPNEKRPIITIDFDKPFEGTIPDNTIIIGTFFAWKYVPWSKLAIMAIMDADTPLFVPEYRTSERLWLEIREALYLLPNNVPLLIQTNHPDHPVFQALSDPRLLYDQELSQRKLLRYPPFRYLLKIMYGSVNEAEVKRETHTVYQHLLGLTKSDQNCTIAKPYELVPALQKGKYWQCIVIKLPYSAYKRYWKKIVFELSEDWKVDPNPLTIFTL